MGILLFFLPSHRAVITGQVQGISHSYVQMRIRSQGPVPEGQVLIQDKNFVPFLYFTFLCIGWSHIFCYHYCMSE